jgi:hypothetical protein
LQYKGKGAHLLLVLVHALGVEVEVVGGDGHDPTASVILMLITRVIIHLHQLVTDTVNEAIGDKGVVHLGLEVANPIVLISSPMLLFRIAVKCNLDKPLSKPGV